VDLLPRFQAEIADEERGGSQIAASATTPPHGVRAGDRQDPLGPRSAFENIALAHREVYALYEIAQSMGTSLGVEDTMALISSKLTNIVPWSGCALFLFQRPTDSLRCRFTTGVDAARLFGTVLKNGRGLEGWVARNRRTIVNGNPKATFDAVGGNTELKSAIVCPLFFNDAFIGALSLYHTERDRYSEDHRRLLEQIAEQAGAVIHNSIVFEQTQEDSLTDPLTGLPNRRSMFVHLSRELSRAERLQADVALIVMDIDEFKTINDTYGHHVGDYALREVARTLQAELRPYDLCVRYAGDEFIVVMADCSREIVEAKRLELQEKVCQIEFEVRAGKLLRLGASAGASVFPHDGATYEALLADADHKMYRDKAARRGQGTLPALSAEFAPADAFPPAADINSVSAERTVEPSIA
jgi:diguanylate cyclase (GGDEF)-like protein